MLRIAIVGLGRAGMRHVEAIQELCRKITVDCLVDNDPDHLREKATKLDIEKCIPIFTMRSLPRCGCRIDLYPSQSTLSDCLGSRG